MQFNCSSQPLMSSTVMSPSGDFPNDAYRNVRGPYNQGPWIIPHNNGPWINPQVQDPWKIAPAPWSLPPDPWDGFLIEQPIFPAEPSIPVFPSPFPEPIDQTPHIPYIPYPTFTTLYRLRLESPLKPAQLRDLNESLHALLPAAPYFGPLGPTQDWSLSEAEILTIAHSFIYFGLRVTVQQVLVSSPNTLQEIVTNLPLTEAKALDITTLSTQPLFILIAALFGKLPSDPAKIVEF